MKIEIMIHWMLLSIFAIFASGTQLQYIEATDNACVNALEYTSGYKFSPPAIGEMVGIKIEYKTGAVSCGSTANTKFGCQSWGIFIEMIEEGGNAQTIYPTDTTEDVTNLNRLGCNANTGCSVHYYKMDPLYNWDSEYIELIDRNNPYSVNTNQQFSLQFGEGCCQSSHTDNSGTACYKVLFLYSFVAATGQYFAGSSAMSWDQASQFCENQGTTLASIHSAEQRDTAKSLCQEKCTSGSCGCWIGLFRDNPWSWSDESPTNYGFQPDGITPTRGIDPWRTNEPSNSNEGCVQIRDDTSFNFEWNDENCNTVCYPICNLAAAQCPINETKTFNWDTLTSDGIDTPVFNFTMSINENDLSLNIEVEVEYIVNAYADNQPDPNFGTTYVLDFEDFDAHKSSISLPGSCSNRLASDYGQDSNTYFIINSDAINAIGTRDNMCYPPAGDDITGWSINTDEMCTTVKYSGSWTWGELRECVESGGDKQTFIIDDTDPNYDEKYLALSGTFYINLISPFWYKNYPGELINFYRVYQLVSQPWIIQVSKSVYVIGTTGINVMTMSIIAVYKEDQDSDYTLILLTETAEYMMLETPNLMEPLIIAGTQLNILTTAETGTGNDACLNNKAYLCSQLWKIEAEDVFCDTNFDNGAGGIDFSDTYKIKFEPICRTDNGNTIYNENSHCTNWLQSHPEFDINNAIEYKGVVLESDLVFVDKICEAEIFTVQLEAEMQFYEEPNIETGVIEYGTVIPLGSDYLYQVGESIIYGEIILNFPTDTEDIFSSTLVNVWLCTFPPLNDETATRAPPDQNGPTDPIDTATNGGCFSAERDGFIDGDTSDFFFHIFSSQTGIETEDFELIDDGVTNSNIIKFTFLCPNEIERDTLYVHAQVEVLLQELETTTPPPRRMLLNVANDNKHSANKFAHFGKNIGITNNPIENKPVQPEIPPQQPIQQPPSMVEPFTISLNSYWVIIIGVLLSIILTFNIIFMAYMNCCKSRNTNRRRGYYSVKHIDSEEFDDSEANLINVN